MITILMEMPMVTSSTKEMGLVLKEPVGGRVGESHQGG